MARRRTWIATLDIETRSRANLKLVGAWKYSRDPSTELLCLSYSIDGGDIVLWKRGEPMPTALCEHIERGGFVEAHNVFFEWCVWRNVAHARMEWPELRLDRLFCSAARAAVACLPRALDQAVVVAGLDVRKGDDTAMKKLSKPRKPTKNDPREWFDDPHLFEQLYEYNKGDVAAEIALSHATAPLSAFERKVFRADARINARGIRIDTGLVDAALRLNAQIGRELSSELFELTDGRVMAATERDRLIEYLEDTGLVVDAIDKETVEDALLGGTKLTPKQRRILEIRREGSRSSVSKYSAFRAVADTDGVVRGLYVYYGANAHGRFSGKLVQPQNFPRGDIKDKGGAKKDALMEKMVSTIKRAAKRGGAELLRDTFVVERSEVFGDPQSKRVYVPASPAEVLSTALRGVFIARDGKTFGVGDYSAIEARALFWLADCKRGLKIYRDDGDIYRDMGSDIFNKPPETLNESFERMMGKTVVLGCGYEMSWRKFKATCKRAYNMIIDDDLAKKCVTGYRNRYPEVPVFWRSLQDAAIKCVRTGIDTDVRLIGFSMYRGHLRIELPSGRAIWHRHARISKGKYGDQLVFVGGKGYIESTYGGKICEYVTSGTARDMLADAIVKAEFERDDTDVVMHSHDEIVCEGEPGHVGHAVEEIMSDQPKWSRGLPIKVEAWESARYRK